MSNPVIIIPDDETLVRLADEAKTVREAFETSFRAKFAPGEPVRWVWGLGGVTYAGTVVRNGLGTRLYVRNDATGAEYWIHGWRVLDALRS